MAETLIDTGPFSAALGQWGRQRGLRPKDISDGMARAMGALVKNALRKIPKADRGKISRDLLTIIGEERKSRSRSGGGGGKFRHTLAARLVYLLDYHGAREQFRSGSPRFEETVDRWYRARLYSVGLHRAGLLPALSLLRQSGGEGLPRYRRQPGSARLAFSGEDVEIIVRNWASAADSRGRQAAGITRLAGDAFEHGLSEMERRVAAFLHGAMEDAARRSGLKG